MSTNLFESLLMSCFLFSLCLFQWCLNFLPLIVIFYGWALGIIIFNYSQDCPLFIYSSCLIFLWLIERSENLWEIGDVLPDSLLWVFVLLFFECLKLRVVLMTVLALINFFHGGNEEWRDEDNLEIKEFG